MFHPMRKSLIYLVILSAFILMTACSPKSSIVYNQLGALSEGAPPYIEGAYSDDTMKASSFDDLTGIQITKCLPEPYANNDIQIMACYDKDGNILNLTARMTEQGATCSTILYAHSKEQWSELSYSPVDYGYGDGHSVNDTISYVDDLEVKFYHYDDSKSDYPLGYDVLYAEFSINSITVYAASTIMNKSEFEAFIISIIKSASED